MPDAMKILPASTSFCRLGDAASLYLHCVLFKFCYVIKEPGVSKICHVLITTITTLDSWFMCVSFTNCHVALNLCNRKCDFFFSLTKQQVDICCVENLQEARPVKISARLEEFLLWTQSSLNSRQIMSIAGIQHKSKMLLENGSF